MHEIKVISIPDLIRARSYVNKKKHYIVQIQYHGTNDYPVIEFTNTIKNITLTFDDVNKGDEGFIGLYDAGKVDVIAELLITTNNQAPVYVCCVGGLSRSPAVALGLLNIIASHTITKSCSVYISDVILDYYKRYPHHNKDVLDAIMKRNNILPTLIKDADFKCPSCNNKMKLYDVGINGIYCCSFCGLKLTNKNIVVRTIKNINDCFPDKELDAFLVNKQQKKHWWNKK